MIAAPCTTPTVDAPMTRTARGRLRRMARSAPPTPAVVAPAPAPAIRPQVRFTRGELVDLLKEYRAAEGLTPAQRAEAVAWIVGHQHEPRPS